jgi:hypothetical protein
MPVRPVNGARKTATTARQFDLSLATVKGYCAVPVGVHEPLNVWPKKRVRLRWAVSNLLSLGFQLVPSGASKPDDFERNEGQWHDLPFPVASPAYSNEIAYKNRGFEHERIQPPYRRQPKGRAACGRAVVRP